MKQMREKILRDRVRKAREAGPHNADPHNAYFIWAKRYAKDVETMRQLLTAFVIADVARAISMDDYPGLTNAEKDIHGYTDQD